MRNRFLQLIVAAAGILIAKNINAQEGFHLGVQWGPHLSWLLNNDDISNKNFEYHDTWRGAFALNSQYGFTSETGIGVSMLYSFQGQRYTLSGVELFKRVEYVKIPVMFIYNYDAYENLSFIYKIGPQIGLLTHARLTNKNGNDIVSNQKEAYRNAELGITASAGIGIKLAHSFFVDMSVRYDYGFTGSEKENASVNEPGNDNGNNISSGRAGTNTMTAGVNIGLRYLFSANKK